MKRCLALLVVLSIVTSYALACSCVVPPPPAEALEQAAAVFSGTVTDVATKDGRKSVTIKVDRSWKGVDAETVTVITAAGGGGTCGYVFDKGTAYLVYAYKSGEGKDLSTNICTRTTTIANAKDDLTALGEGKKIESKK